MTEDIPEDLKQLENEYPEGKWKTYTGLEANIKGNEFINNILSKMEEGQKIPVNGEPNTYAVKQGGKLLIVLPPRGVSNPDCTIEIKSSEVWSNENVDPMQDLLDLANEDHDPLKEGQFSVIELESIINNSLEVNIDREGKVVGSIKSAACDAESGLVYAVIEITDEEALKEITKKVNNESN